MAITKVEIRRGTYCDSLVLMQLQVALTALPGIGNAGVMMGLDTNKEVLKESGLLTPEAEAALPDDLIISIEGDTDAAVSAALTSIDALLSRRRTPVQQDYRPKTLAAAAKMSPDAAWVLISVPGEYAAAVAREALRLKKHLFLYSDHVSLEDEVSLKQEAAKQGLLLMGPDCGTAIINGVGLGFANKIRRGPIGLIGASGTGLQQVTARIHQLDSGVTHALGTGGRDLSVEVGGASALQSLDLLRRDDETKVIVLISKPPAPEVAAQLLEAARMIDKPVVVNFIGHQASRANGDGNLFFASTLDDAAELAVKLSHSGSRPAATAVSPVQPARSSGYLRGLFSGGTLAYETLLILRDYLPAVYSNIPLKKKLALKDVQTSQEHTILDLGEDAFTAGRPHPMLDNTLRLQRLEQEARDPKVGVILLDVVLGYGAHPNPAGELAPAISRVRSQAKQAGRELEVVAVLVGTDEDPQDYESQLRQLEESGARLETGSGAAAHYVGQRLQREASLQASAPVDLRILRNPLQAINMGLESFAESVLAQGGTAVHVDWRPPAGGNVKLMSILGRMKS